jgi:predicted GNAT superfamily acetyltransferase
VRGQHVRPDSEDWLNQDEIPFVTRAVWSNSLPHPATPDVELDADTLLVQVPPNIQKMKQTDVSIAVEWRKVTRLVFETYFRRGYVVTGYASSKTHKPRIPNIYRMEKKSFPAPIDFSAWSGGIKFS